jgi:hypothetical protein
VRRFAWYRYLVNEEAVAYWGLSRKNQTLMYFVCIFHLLINSYQLLSGVCGLLIHNFDTVNLILLKILYTPFWRRYAKCISVHMSDVWVPTLSVWLTTSKFYGFHGKCPSGMKHHLTISSVYIPNHGFIFTSTSLCLYETLHVWQCTASNAAGHTAVYHGGGGEGVLGNKWVIWSNVVCFHQNDSPVSVVSEHTVCSIFIGG